MNENKLSNLELPYAVLLKKVISELPSEVAVRIRIDHSPLSKLSNSSKPETAVIPETE